MINNPTSTANPGNQISSFFFFPYSDIREHFVDNHKAFNAKLEIQSIVIALLHDDNSSSQRVGLSKYAQETWSITFKR